MSVEAISIVLNHSQARGSARLVLLGIANHHGDGGAWPTLRTLQKYAGGITERNVRAALRELERLGELYVEIQAGGTARTRNGQRPNRYHLVLACPRWCDRSLNHRDLRSTDESFDLPWGRRTPVAGDPRTPVAGDPRTPVAGDPRTPVAGDPQTRRGTIR